MNTTDFLAETRRLFNQWEIQEPNERKARDIMESALHRIDVHLFPQNHPKLPVGRPPSERTDAVDFLRGVLAGGPVPSDDVIQLAYQVGHTRSTLKRARKSLGVLVERDRVQWYMQLPPSVPTSSPPPEPAHSHGP